jgi:TonB-dependent receptor-like protein/carboxypeptidase family protein
MGIKSNQTFLLGPATPQDRLLRCLGSIMKDLSSIGAHLPSRFKSVLLLIGVLLPAYGQTRLGRILLQVQDESGALLPGVRVLLASDQTHVLANLVTNPSGELVFRGLRFGPYRIIVDDARFEPIVQDVLVSSEVSQSFLIRLRVRGPASQVNVSNTAPLVDPQRINSSLYRGEAQIRQRLASLPNRDLVEMVASFPGWILEANGVLHPRGSEYQTQYVFDGVPIFDNRSPGFASAPIADAADSFEVVTAGIPAEFGRKLGGVINVASRTAWDEGRGAFQIYGGNQSLIGGALQVGGSTGRLGYSGAISASHTSRYLDPPALENFHNQANLASGFMRLDFAPDKEDVFRLFAWANYTHLQVPNEVFQEEAGQQQMRLNRDQDVTLSWEHYYSSQAVSTLAVYTRHLSADLRSNPLSTPLLTQQDREFSAHGANASLSKIVGTHQFKFGTDVILSPVKEFFSVAVTDSGFFEETRSGDEIPASLHSILDFTPDNPFLFSERRNSVDYSFFAQDQWRMRNLTLSLGLRYDGYRFLIHDHAWSPRVGAAYFIPTSQTNLHFAYDRAFQTPTIENLLLTSSAAAQALSPLWAQGQQGAIPVPAGRAHFYEAGFSQGLGRWIRVDGHLFRRDLKNFEDDDVFFNTGISFPITMNKARIKGAELRAEVSRWRGLSGFASYSNLLGVAFTPITGGLFLGEQIASLLPSNQRFPISQDQRNTLQFRMHFQPARSRWWVAGGMRYASGLPVELEDGTNLEELQSSFPQAILNQVNFSRNRLRPHHVWDASAGLRFWSEEKRLARLQLDLLNLTNRLYLINFEGLLSGTALGLRRTAVVKLAFEF